MGEQHQPSRAAVLVMLLLVTVQVATGAPEDDYSKLLDLSFLFFEAQMSGQLPAWNRLLATQPGGYKHNAHLTDGAVIGRDLSGGFYDAGDYLKCPLPLGWTLSNLVLSCLEFKAAYEAAGHWDTAVNVIRWGADWMIKAHVNASDVPAENVFVGQISDKSDLMYFGRPEHATNPRPVYLVNSSTGGADVAAEYAAAFAATAVLFRSINETTYAETLWKHAQQAVGFAEAYQTNYKIPGSVFQAYSTFAKDGYTAHLAWASSWMCKYMSSIMLTTQNSYCQAASRWFDTALRGGLYYNLGYDWDNVLPGAAAVLVGMNLQPVAQAAKAYLEGFVLDKWEDTNSLCPKPAYSTVCYTPKGLAYYSDWGTLRNTANMMFIASLMAKYGTRKQQHVCWARMQFRYITGSLGGTNRSYVIGYGPSYPQQPFHRHSACPANYSGTCTQFNGGTCCGGESGTGSGGCCDAANFASHHPAPIKLRGALVGGPDQSDHFPDIRVDYQRSQVALDYNAGLTGAAAALAYFASTGLLAPCGAGPGILTPILSNSTAYGANSSTSQIGSNTSQTTSRLRIAAPAAAVQPSVAHKLPSVLANKTQTSNKLPSGPLVVGYYVSGASSQAKQTSSSTVDGLDIVDIPGYINVLVIGFAQPDCTYQKDSLEFAGTGLRFDSPGYVIKAAMDALRQQQPNTRVLLGVGGPMYTKFGLLNTTCIKDVVDDFGFDGIDFNHQTPSNCVRTSGKGATCPATDQQSVKGLTDLRTTLPSHTYILSLSTRPMGLFGASPFEKAKPVTNITGVNLAMARSEAGKSLDLVNVMAYDAGNWSTTGFSWQEAYRAARFYWPEKAVTVAVAVGPDNWPLPPRNHRVSIDGAATRAKYVKEHSKGAQYGITLWNLQKQGCPNARQLSTAVCSAYGLDGCKKPLPFVQQTCILPSSSRLGRKAPNPKSAQAGLNPSTANKTAQSPVPPGIPAASPSPIPSPGSPVQTLAPAASSAAAPKSYGDSVLPQESPLPASTPELQAPPKTVPPADLGPSVGGSAAAQSSPTAVAPSPDIVATTPTTDSPSPTPPIPGLVASYSPAITNGSSDQQSSTAPVAQLQLSGDALKQSNSTLGMVGPQQSTAQVSAQSTPSPSSPQSTSEVVASNSSASIGSSSEQIVIIPVPRSQQGAGSSAQNSTTVRASSPQQITTPQVSPVPPISPEPVLSSSLGPISVPTGSSTEQVKGAPPALEPQLIAVASAQNSSTLPALGGQQPMLQAPSIPQSSQGLSTAAEAQAPMDPTSGELPSQAAANASLAEVIMPIAASNASLSSANSTQAVQQQQKQQQQPTNVTAIQATGVLAEIPVGNSSSASPSTGVSGAEPTSGTKASPEPSTILTVRLDSPETQRPLTPGALIEPKPLSPVAEPATPLAVNGVRASLGISSNSSIDSSNSNSSNGQAAQPVLIPVNSTSTPELPASDVVATSSRPVVVHVAGQPDDTTLNPGSISDLPTPAEAQQGQPTTDNLAGEPSAPTPDPDLASPPPPAAPAAAGLTTSDVLDSGATPITPDDVEQLADEATANVATPGPSRSPPAEALPSDSAQMAANSSMRSSSDVMVPEAPPIETLDGTNTVSSKSLTNTNTKLAALMTGLARIDELLPNNTNQQVVALPASGTNQFTFSNISSAVGPGSNVSSSGLRTVNTTLDSVGRPNGADIFADDVNRHNRTVMVKPLVSNPSGPMMIGSGPQAWQAASTTASPFTGPINMDGMVQPATNQAANNSAPKAAIQAVSSVSDVRNTATQAAGGIPSLNTSSHLRTMGDTSNLGNTALMTEVRESPQPDISRTVLPSPSPLTSADTPSVSGNGVVLANSTGPVGADTAVSPMHSAPTAAAAPITVPDDTTLASPVTGLIINTSTTTPTPLAEETTVSTTSTTPSITSAALVAKAAAAATATAAQRPAANTQQAPGELPSEPAILEPIYDPGAAQQPPVPTEPIQPGVCAVEVPAWTACGGISGTCPPALIAAGKCMDAPWEGHCCPAGHYCKRENVWFWMCSPGTGDSSIAEPYEPYELEPEVAGLEPQPQDSAEDPNVCKVTVPGWQGCGGQGAPCPPELVKAGKCADAAWEGYCCATGWKCARDTQWWWMCRQDESYKPPSQTSAQNARLRDLNGGAPRCNVSIDLWGSCGGSGSQCPEYLRNTSKCVDAVWDGHCCSEGSACVRDNEWYYQCRPALTTTDAAASAAAAPLVTTAGIVAEKFDTLLINAPKIALASRRQTVEVALSRQGQPVSDAAVQVTLTTATTSKVPERAARIMGQVSATVTLQGLTASDGTVSFQVPKAVLGRSGYQTLVSAISTDARARGGRGDVITQAPEAVILWL